MSGIRPGPNHPVRPNVWVDTYDRLSASDPADLTPADLEALADSAWLVCRLDESLVARQHAYAGYLETRDEQSAARAAWRMFWDHLYNGDKVVALGWLRRARRHVAAIPEGAEHGYVALADAELALNRGLPGEAAAHAARAVEIGTRHDTQSIVAFGLTLHGRALIAQGRLDEGCASMDEAMTLVLSARLDAFFTGAVYCTVIAECRDVADLRRAAEWTDAASAWCSSLPVVTPFHGICRIHRGEVLGLRGAWTQAEAEIRTAGDELAAFKPRSAAEALYALAEIQRRRGDLAGAEHSFLRARARPGPTARPGARAARAGPDRDRGRRIAYRSCRRIGEPVETRTAARRGSRSRPRCRRPHASQDRCRRPVVDCRRIRPARDERHGGTGPRRGTTGR